MIQIEYVICSADELNVILPCAEEHILWNCKGQYRLIPKAFFQNLNENNSGSIIIHWHEGHPIPPGIAALLLSGYDENNQSDDNR